MVQKILPHIMIVSGDNVILSSQNYMLIEWIFRTA